MFAAPLRDLQNAVSIGQNGLGDLNPTPWAFMLGNCIGWTTYGIITNNWFIFWANYPGFLISCWLNLGAVKLLYSYHHQQIARTSIVNYLTQSQQLQQASQQLALLNVNDDDNDNDDDEVVTPHERLIMGIIVLWTLVVSGIGFYSVITTSSNTDVDTTINDTNNSNNNIPQLIVGYIVNLNLIFFYGAPLSAIQTVLKTKQNNTLHVPTMITNTLCSIFWTAYAVAPQINDPFIYVPNGLGVLLGLIQFILYMIFPRSSSTPESKITAITEQQQQQHTDVTTSVVDV
ncbi:hypothetical protein FRACYDRAFT_197687 [Fragilariopsis cylindrus CCMP1102]|uniref:Sugar transporter SWEET1 n=1 Tax=Fragilariopsis cylindrus CCMP1102 TaxID=635003 RepID=A0A1E7EN73_9STRA|nr:hypothetical protein FRACYDRAFT_197687 [Fragilariopsis cylindrus CCMP1102]|eukprot:OEU07398.1 hypothetical protein FRACYDRAFT_197687 [Fragilariopsis cylindrus CCMP1102]